MYLALTYDHRLLDGREAVTFLVKVCNNSIIRIIIRLFTFKLARLPWHQRTVGANHTIGQGVHSRPPQDAVVRGCCCRMRRCITRTLLCSNINPLTRIKTLMVQISSSVLSSLITVHSKPCIRPKIRLVRNSHQAFNTTSSIR